MSLVGVAWALGTACGPADGAPPDAVETQAASAEGDLPPEEGEPAPDQAPIVEPSTYVGGGWAGGDAAELTGAYCTPGTAQLCPDGTVSRCTLSAHTKLETLDGPYGIVCIANTSAERHCSTGRLKKCVVPGTTSGAHGWFLNPAGSPMYKSAQGIADNVAEFHSTGHIWKFIQSGSTNYHNGTSGSDTGCAGSALVTMYSTGYLQSCTSNATYGKTIPGATPPMGSPASFTCRAGYSHSFHPNHGLASCTFYAGTLLSSTAPTPFGTATCAKGTTTAPLSGSLHASGYLASCTLGADFVANTSAGAFTCQAGKPLTLDSAGNITACTLAAEATVPTQRGLDATCKAGSTIGLTAAGDLIGSCTLKTALTIPRVPIGAAAAASMTCAANTSVTITTDGYASRCTPTTDQVVGSQRSGNVVCRANAQLAVFTSASARGQLQSCTPPTGTSVPVVREAAPADATSCAGGLTVTLHEDGYLNACTLVAGSAENVTGPAPGLVALRCSAGKVAFDAAGVVTACTIADPETLTTERYSNISCGAGSALSFTAAGKVYGTCLLTANAAVGFVPVGTAAAKAVTCKAATPLILTASGYASTCTPTAELAVARTVKNAGVLSCQANNEVDVVASGASAGYVLSCRVGGAAAYTVYVAPIGEALQWVLGAKVGTDVVFFDDGFVSLATSHGVDQNGVYGVRTFDDPDSTATENVSCKHNAPIAIQTANRRLAVCTLGRPQVTGVHSVDGKRRICPRFGEAEFSTRGTGTGVYEVISTVDGVSASTACPLEPGEACTSSAQCAPGATCITTSNTCGKVPSGGQCTLNAQCASSACSMTTYTCS